VRVVHYKNLHAISVIRVTGWIVKAGLSDSDGAWSPCFNCIQSVNFWQRPRGGEWGKTFAGQGSYC